MSVYSYNYQSFGDWSAQSLIEDLSYTQLLYLGDLTDHHKSREKKGDLLR